jgi:hypothetical protein
MRVSVLRGAGCLTVFIFTLTFGLSCTGIRLVTTAQAQAVPKTLEQGGSDAVMRVRKNAWTVGVAGGQLSGTYMTFANEMAQVLDDGDNLRVLLKSASCDRSHSGRTGALFWSIRSGISLHVTPGASDWAETSPGPGT